MGQRHLLGIFGLIALFLLVTGVGYSYGYSTTWEQHKSSPKIGAETLDIKLVFLKRDLAAGEVVDIESVDEKHALMPGAALDAYGFASEVQGRKLKWAMHKGDYLSRHDVFPEAEEQLK